jgi:hypothetical protein
MGGKSSYRSSVCAEPEVEWKLQDPSTITEQSLLDIIDTVGTQGAVMNWLEHTPPPPLEIASPRVVAQAHHRGALGCRLS